MHSVQRSAADRAAQVHTQGRKGGCSTQKSTLTKQSLLTVHRRVQEKFASAPSVATFGAKKYCKKKRPRFSLLLSSVNIGHAFVKCCKALRALSHAYARSLTSSVGLRRGPVARPGRVFLSLTLKLLLGGGGVQINRASTKETELKCDFPSPLFLLFLRPRSH